MNQLGFMKAISEPLRLRIIALLRQSNLSGSDLVHVLEVSQSNISHHLAILIQNDIVESHKRGTQKIYVLKEINSSNQLAGDIWSHLEEIVSEISEAPADQFRLQELLKGKTDFSSEYWETWRLQQPDLPYTEEFIRHGLPVGEIAIDVGCGNGEFCKLLAQSYEQVVGFDLVDWEESWADLSADYSNLHFAVSDGQKLPFKKQSVQSIFFRMSIAFIENPKHALTEASRVCAPGGKIIIIEKSDNLKKIGFEKINIPDLKHQNEIAYPHIKIMVLKKKEAI